MGLFNDIFGGGSDAAEDAYEKSAAFSKKARQELTTALTRQEGLYNQGVDRYKPYADIGLEALPQLLAMAGVKPSTSMLDMFNRQGISPAGTYDITDDPGYQFRLQQGEQAMTRRAAAGGKRFSGETLMDLAKYGQDYASTEFDKAFQRTAGIQNTLYGIGSGARDQITGLEDVMSQRYGIHAGNMANLWSGQGTTAANAELAEAGMKQKGLSNLFGMAGTALGVI